MSKKPVTIKDDIWINPNFSLKKEERSWERRLPAGIPKVSRYLELADIALGVKRPERRKKMAWEAE